MTPWRRRRKRTPAAQTGQKLRDKCDRDRKGTDSAKKTNTTTFQKSHGQKQATKTKKTTRYNEKIEITKTKTKRQRQKRQSGEICSAPPAYEADN